MPFVDTNGVVFRVVVYDAAVSERERSMCLVNEHRKALRIVDTIRVD